MRRTALEFCSTDQDWKCSDERLHEALLANPAAQAAIARARQLRLLAQGFSAEQIAKTYAYARSVMSAVEVDSKEA